MGRAFRRSESARPPLKRREWPRAGVLFAGIGAWIAAAVLAVLGEWLWMAVSAALALAADRAGRAWSRRAPVPFPYRLRGLLFIPRVLLSPGRVRRILQPRSGERFLEIGPGVGVHALPIAASLLPGGALEALDVQREMLGETARRAARRGLTNIVPRQADARRLPYPDRSFDAAYLVGVLGEIPQPQAALRELRRVLKDGGRLLIGEVLIDPDFIPFPRLKGMARGAGLRFERKSGPGFAYCAVFRPASPPGVSRPASPPGVSRPASPPGVSRPAAEPGSSAPAILPPSSALQAPSSVPGRPDGGEHGGKR